MKLDTVTDVLNRVREAAARVRALRLDLTLLALCLALQDEHPTVADFTMDMTDQGGETMVPGSIILANGEYVDSGDSNALWSYTSDLEYWQLDQECEFWEASSSEVSGTLHVQPLLDELTKKYEGLLGELEFPFPDPSDTKALLAWLES